NRPIWPTSMIVTGARRRNCSSHVHTGSSADQACSRWNGCLPPEVGWLCRCVPASALMTEAMDRRYPVVKVVRALSLRLELRMRGVLSSACASGSLSFLLVDGRETPVTLALGEAADSRSDVSSAA